MTQPDRPAARLRALVDGYRISDAIFAAVELNIADHLASGPISVDELALAISAQPDPLYRLMRALASVGVFEEDGDRRFSLNDMGELLRADAPGSVKGWSALVGRQYAREAWGRLAHTVVTGENAFSSLHGGISVWEWRRERPEENELFNRAMTSNVQLNTAAFLDAYDFGRFRVIADIGGNDGEFLVSVMRRHPGTNGILFDQPHVVPSATTKLAEADLSDRCQVVGGSFFDSVPSGADAYVIQRVLHDWDDGDCVRILKSIHTACAGAPLLILEAVVGPPNTDPVTKFLDLQMLLVPGGRERSAPEWEALLNQAGFEMDTVVPTASGQSVIEASAH